MRPFPFTRPWYRGTFRAFSKGANTSSRRMGFLRGSFRAILESSMKPVYDAPGLQEARDSAPDAGRVSPSIPSALRMRASWPAGNTSPFFRTSPIFTPASFRRDRIARVSPVTRMRPFARGSMRTSGTTGLALAGFSATGRVVSPVFSHALNSSGVNSLMAPSPFQPFS